MAATPVIAQEIAPDGPAVATKFKNKYAPHFGMFEDSVGKDLFDHVNHIFKWLK